MSTCRHFVRAGVFTAGLIAASLTAGPGGGFAHAQSLDALLRETIPTHDRIVGAEADVVASKNRAREALGDWFPVFEPTVNYGYEKQENPGGGDTSTPFSEVDLSLTQLLWDFGATNAAVEKARLELIDTKLSLALEKETLIQEAVDAYVNVMRDDQVLQFARQSKDNIRRQTGLEEARVETGSGLTTDVLQAKSKLAQADSREIQSEGTLITSTNRFKAVFARTPDIRKMVPVRFPVELIPGSLDQAIQLAITHNTEILQQRIAESIARQDVKAARGEEFFPKIEGVVEQKYKNNVGGTFLLKKETLAKIELSIPFNLGLTAINTLRAAEADVIAEARTVADTRRNIEEEVRNAWQELHTARATARSLHTQAEIQAGFLDLAKEERKLGQRSLIDVLTGEVDLINAQSDAASAEADVIIAAYNLLRIIGKLNFTIFTDELTTSLPVQFQLPPRPSATQPIPASHLQALPASPRTSLAEQSAPALPVAPLSETIDETTGVTLGAKAPFDRFFKDVRGIFSQTFKDSQAPAADPGQPGR